MKKGPIKYIFVQSTSLCSLNCDYCYLSEADRKQANTFPLDNVETVFTKLLNSNYTQQDTPLMIVWHIGEPLLLPIQYYKQFIATVQTIMANLPNKTLDVRFGLQTNGIHITPEWCHFFKEHDIQVGLSCDGPAFLHDAHRKRRNNQGTHQQVMQAINLLKSERIDFSVLSVITAETLPHADAFFHFFADNQLYDLGLNFVRKVAAHEDELLQDELEQCKQFTKELFNLYFAYRLKYQERRVRIREFESIAGTLFTNNSQPILPGGITAPLQMINIDHLGNFSTFDPQLISTPFSHYEGNDFILGNLCSGNLDEMVESKKFKAIENDIEAGFELCLASCEYFDVCNGCFPASKYGEHQSFLTTETIQCKLMVKTIADIVVERFQQHLEEEQALVQPTEALMV